MQEVSVLEVRPSFSSYASFDFAETKPKDLGVSCSFAFNETKPKDLGVSCSFAFNETENKEEESKEADGFEFEALCGDHEVLTISADEIFLNGKIRSMPPLVLHAHSEAKTTRNKLKNFLEEERVSESKCVREEEEEVLDPETFCEWKPKSSSKKSSSTSSSRRWKLRDLIRRSNSEGGENMVSGKEALPAREVKVKSAHEIHYTKNRAMKEADRRRSFLPYRQDLVGLFGNVNGFSKALKPVLG